VILGPIREQGLWAGISAGLTDADIATAHRYAEASAEALAKYEWTSKGRGPSTRSGKVADGCALSEADGWSGKFAQPRRPP
jgi:hypothetical protein